MRLPIGEDSAYLWAMRSLRAVAPLPVAYLFHVSITPLVAEAAYRVGGAVGPLLVAVPINYLATLAVALIGLASLPVAILLSLVTSAASIAYSGTPGLGHVVILPLASSLLYAASFRFGALSRSRMEASTRCGAACVAYSLLGASALAAVPLASAYLLVSTAGILYDAFGRLSELLAYEEARAAWRAIYESNLVRLVFFAVALIVYYRLVKYLAMPVMWLALESPSTLRAQVVGGIREEAGVIASMRAWYHRLYYRLLWAASAYALGIALAPFYLVLRSLLGGSGPPGAWVAAGAVYILLLILLPRRLSSWTLHWRGARLAALYSALAAAYLASLYIAYGVDPSIALEVALAVVSPGYEAGGIYTSLDAEIAAIVEARFRLLEDYVGLLIRLLLGG